MIRLIYFILLMFSIYFLLVSISLFFNISEKFNSFSSRLSGFDSLKLVKSINLLALDRFLSGLYGVILSCIILVFKDISMNFQITLACIYFLVRIVDMIIVSRLKQ